MASHIPSNLTRLPIAPKLHGGKRGATGPLINISSSDEDETESSPSPRESSPRLPIGSNSLIRSKSPSIQQACEAYEHDHDYENVASPVSSTSSGPIYVRPPGFRYHGHEILAKREKIKKKKTNPLLDLPVRLRRRAPTPPKIKPRKEPLPMRLRALPQSFWKQPNVPNQISPGNIFPTLPPLCNKETGEDVAEVRPITPPEDRETVKKQPRPPDRKIIVGDPDLLLKHLFAVVDDKNQVRPVVRPSPKKMLLSKNTKALINGEDPYLVEAVTQKLFPQLSLENSRQGHGGNSTLQLITLKEGDKPITLPTLSLDQNYSQMLSELAMNI
ncbi:hypothetical protein ScPMuIL_008457 [Solemya velum]